MRWFCGLPAFVGSLDKLANRLLFQNKKISPGGMTMTDLQTNVLETKRLLLRRLTMADLDALFTLYSDPAVRKYFPEGTLTYEETKEELEWIINVYYGQYGFGLWATIHKETGEFIGRCGLLPWTIEQHPEVEVAYMLAKAYWGQGLGTEAAQAILDYSFEQLQLSRLICLIDRENQASINVAQKIGMTFEKEVDDGKGPALLYSTSIREPA
jgi:ribosomal-protein-alanine N-acetyltransferase